MQFRMAESPDDSKILSMVPDRLRLSTEYTMMFDIVFALDKGEGTTASFMKQQHKQLTTKLKTINRNNQKMDD